MTTVPTADEICWVEEPNGSATTDWNAMDLTHLLGRVEEYIRRYVVLSDDQALAVTLWVAHTHTIGAADCTPYLHITAATKRAGKTRLLEVLEPIVARPWKTDRVSAAVLVRKIDAEQPTLLLDESDAALRVTSEYSEALRGLLNSGYRRGGKSSLCVGLGANITYRDFSTFAPKAIAGIGQLPDTVADRSIHIVLRRRMASEPVARWREREGHAEAAPLADDLVRWSELALPALEDARPALPDGLDDRATDVWEPLLAIADRAGGAWPAGARRAAEALSGTVDDTDIVVELLLDIREILSEADSDVIASKTLLEQLVALEDRPWGEWRRGQELTARGLARLLGPLGICPNRHETLSGRLRGYRRDAFRDAMARYLPS